MPKIKLAICDTDRCFRERFVSYFIKHKAEEAEVFSYSDAEIFLQNRGKNPVEIILLGENESYLLPELENENVPLLVLFEEQMTLPKDTAGCLKPALEKRQERKENLEENEKITWLSRYQSMEILWHKICVLTASEQSIGYVKQLMQEINIVGVYAPGGHEMQLFFSLLYGRMLLKEQKVLYLNFIPYVDFAGLFGKESRYNMNDFVLALRNHQITREMIYDCIEEFAGISYIAPFYSPESIYEMTVEDYQEFLCAIMEYTDYQTILIDFGIGMNQLARMLESCQTIFCITKEGFYYQSQWKQFAGYLNSKNKVLETRLQMINLPFHAKWIRGGGNLMEQLEWSEFGDFMRNYFAGGGHE